MCEARHPLTFTLNAILPHPPPPVLCPTLREPAHLLSSPPPSQPGCFIARQPSGLITCRPSPPALAPSHCRCLLRHLSSHHLRIFAASRPSPFRQLVRRSQPPSADCPRLNPTCPPRPSMVTHSPTHSHTPFTHFARSSVCRYLLPIFPPSPHVHQIHVHGLFAITSITSSS